MCSFLIYGCEPCLPYAIAHLVVPYSLTDVVQERCPPKALKNNGCIAILSCQHDCLSDIVISSHSRLSNVILLTFDSKSCPNSMAGVIFNYFVLFLLECIAYYYTVDFESLNLNFGLISCYKYNVCFICEQYCSLLEYQIYWNSLIDLFTKLF